MTDLGQTNDPTVLIPGDPEAVTGTAEAMTAYGDELHNAGQGLRTIDTTGGWSNPRELHQTGEKVLVA